MSEGAARLLRSRRGALLVMTGVGLLLASGLHDHNLAHVLAAFAFAGAIVVLYVNGALALRFESLRIHRPLKRYVDAFALLCLLGSVFAPLVVMALHGSGPWGLMTLLGGMLLMWSVLDIILYHRGLALRTLARIALSWLILLVGISSLVKLGVAVTATVLIASLAISVLTVRDAMRRIDRPWGLVHVAVVAVPSLGAYIGHVAGLV